MQALNSNPIEMNHTQINVAESIGSTVINVTKEVLQTIIQAGQLGPQQFVSVHVTPKQAPLNQLDDRTNQFFHKMMGAINLQLGGIPTLAQSFEILSIVTQDPDIKNKFVQGIAYPHVKKLLEEFDAFNPTIVNEMIGS